MKALSIRRPYKHYDRCLAFQREGAEAAERGSITCPYPITSLAAYFWLRGWRWEMETWVCWDCPDDYFKDPRPS